MKVKAASSSSGVCEGSSGSGGALPLKFPGFKLSWLASPPVKRLPRLAASRVTRYCILNRETEISLGFDKIFKESIWSTVGSDLGHLEQGL